MAPLDKVTCDICGKPVEPRNAVVIRVESPHDLSAARISSNWDACNQCAHVVGEAILDLYRNHHN